jgi:predicted membrane channel-forming protein YqfA (hemolysin III family)
MPERIRRWERVSIATTSVLLGSFGFPTVAHASDMTLVLPVVWIPGLVLIALVSGAMVLVFHHQKIPHWLHILFYVVMGLASLPSLLFATMTLPYLDGQYIEIAWTHMGTFVIAAVATAFAVRESRRALRRERLAPEEAGTPAPPTP